MATTLTTLKPLNLNTTDSYTFGNASITGNITVGNVKTDHLLYANGSAWTFSSYSNTDVAAYLPTYSGIISGTLSTPAQPNITSVGTLTSVSVTANVSAGNILTDHLLYANGVAWDLGGAYSNTNVAAYLPTYTGNFTAGNANVSGTFEASNITTSGTSGNITGANYVVANYFTGTLTTNAQPNITSLGTLTTLSVSGNVTSTYFIGNGSQLTGLPSSYSNADVQAYLPTFTGNFTAGNISTTGNITAAYFIGNGSQLTGLPASYSNTNVAAYLPTYTGNFTAGNANITGVFEAANITTSGTSGNITGANYVVANYFTGTLTTNAQPNITSVGTLSSVSVTGLTTATGGVKTANILDTSGTITIQTKYNSVSGDVGVVGNLVVGTGGTGNITATYLIGNGSQLTGLPASYANSNVASYLPTYTGNVSANYFIGNGSTLTYITGGNVDGQVGNSLVAGTVYTNAQPNITSVGTLSSLSVTGNVTAAYLIGDGSQLTGLPASYANSNVATYLPTYTGNLSPGNLTVGTSANLGAVGNVIITGGSSGQVLSTDGAGTLSWTDQTGGGGGGPSIPMAGVQVFTADGSGNTYTLTSTPADENQITVNIDGVLQLHSSFSLSGNVVTLSGTPVNGAKVEITNISATAGATTGKAIAMAIVFGF